MCVLIMNIKVTPRQEHQGFKPVTFLYIQSPGGLREILTCFPMADDGVRSRLRMEASDRRVAMQMTVDFVTIHNDGWDDDGSVSSSSR